MGVATSAQSIIRSALGNGVGGSDRAALDDVRDAFDRQPTGVCQNVGPGSRVGHRQLTGLALGGRRIGEGDGHRAHVMRHRAAVRPVHPEGAAPQFADLG
jgi:hypothetical protein